MKTLGTILLAAGESARMGGKPKQLLTYKGQTLLRRMAETALALQAGPVVVVLGFQRDRMAAELDGLPVTLVDNDQWPTGQAGSLKTGLAALYLTRKDLDGVLVLHVDQPMVSIGLLLYMSDVWHDDGNGIVACRYDTQLSVPAIFDRDYIPELLQLQGDRGVKWLIARHRDDCTEVPFEAGAVDLDAPRDVAMFRQAVGEE